MQRAANERTTRGGDARDMCEQRLAAKDFLDHSDPSQTTTTLQGLGRPGIWECLSGSRATPAYPTPPIPCLLC